MIEKYFKMVIFEYRSMRIVLAAKKYMLVVGDKFEEKGNV